MEKIGGLRQFGKYLGEDYYIGKAMIKAGYVLGFTHPHPTRGHCLPLAAQR